MQDFNSRLKTADNRQQTKKVGGLQSVFRIFAFSLRSAVCGLQSDKGVSVIGAIIAVLLLFAVGSALLYFSASSQKTRIQQVTGDQSFYSVQAGMEFALRKVIAELSTDVTWSPKFSDETVNIIRSSGVITSSATKHEAYSTHSIADPSPSGGEGCLIVDITGAEVAVNRLQGIIVRRDPSCGEITITGMTGTSWQPDNGELLERIRLDVGGDEFSGPPTASGGNFDFGANDFIINDLSDHNLQLWFDTMDQNHDFELIFYFTSGATNFIKTVNVDFLAENQASCFAWNTVNGRLTYGAGSIWDQLTGTTVSNTCPSAIRLDKMTMSWSPVSPDRNLNIVQVNGGDIYSGTAGSAVEINVDQVIPASTSYDLNYFDFDDEMLKGGRNYTVLWTFSDGSSVTTNFDLFNLNQNNCLTIDTTNASASCDKIIGLTLENTCPADIGVTSLTISWSGDATRRLTEVMIDDVDSSNTYSGSFSSGSPMSFGNNDLYFIDGIGTKLIQYLQFNNSVTSALEFTLMFTMADGTTKSATFTPVVPDQATCLIADATGASLAAANRRLQGITISNNCCFAITWDQTNVSWTSLNPARTFQTLRVGNSNIWSGSVASGETINHSDVVVSAPPASPPTINYFNFNSSMAGRTFTIDFIMGDGSIRTLGPFSP